MVTINLRVTCPMCCTDLTITADVDGTTGRLIAARHVDELYPTRVEEAPPARFTRVADCVYAAVHDA